MSNMDILKMPNLEVGSTHCVCLCNSRKHQLVMRNRAMLIVEDEFAAHTITREDAREYRTPPYILRR